MINTVYKKEFLVGKYLDPVNEFKEKEVPFEIRHDEITGVTCASSASMRHKRLFFSL